MHGSRIVNEPVLSLIQSDHPEKWQEILADLITEPKALAGILQLDPAECPPGLAAADAFPMKVPRPFVQRMEVGNWQDPLLRQVWPSMDEEVPDPSLHADPLQEAQFNVQPGLLHKYRGRVLLTAAPHCAIHCRYCFRRHFDYQANTPGRARWRETLDYIASDISIEEAILSGGDPLAASDSYLSWLLQELDNIPHIKTIRIHTRLPVVIPQRVDSGLLAVLGKLNKRCVIVLHCNHSSEIDQAVAQALSALREQGHTLLNQAVVLKGVNDDSETLASLSRALFEHGVLPYYLHIPDRVSGTGHFRVSETKARELIHQMQSRLPGYLVPTLVREDPGEPNKTRLG
ncbi:MAG: EF-P beta-lysylation protein EpmB [Gammaproteobacteria bacterium]